MAAVEERTFVRAEARYVRTAPRKAQLVAEQIRGRTVPEARTILAFMTRDAARDVEKVLTSAVANAEANHGLDGDELYVLTATVGSGPTLKRWRARARGRVARIKKRTCHITIALALPEEQAIPAPLPKPAPVAAPAARARARARGRRGGGSAEAQARSAQEGRGDRRDGRGEAQAEAGTAEEGGDRRSGREAEAQARAAQEGRAEGERRQAQDNSQAEDGGQLVGHKVHPGGLRVGVIHEWKSNWYTGTKEFPAYLIEDVKIRDHIRGKLGHAGLGDILIKKDKQRITIDIFTARPGIVIGKSGAEVDALRREVHAMTHKNVHININEIKRPELDAKLVAQSIAEQLENRVSFRRAMKRSLASAIRSGAQGVKITCGGRLGGAEMSRSETYSEGRVPLHTLRADIDYGFAEGKTTFGRIGVKVWINKGEIMPEGFDTGRDTGPSGRLGEQDQARRRGGRKPEGLGEGQQAGRRRSPDREGLGPVRQRRRSGERPGGPGGRRGRPWTSNAPRRKRLRPRPSRSRPLPPRPRRPAACRGRPAFDPPPVEETPEAPKDEGTEGAES